MRNACGPHPLLRGRAGWSVVVLAALSLCLSDVPNRGLPFASRTAGSRLPAPQLALRGAGDAGADYAEPELTREEVAELAKELAKLRWGPGRRTGALACPRDRACAQGGGGCRGLFPGRALPQPERGPGCCAVGMCGGQ